MPKVTLTAGLLAMLGLGVLAVPGSHAQTYPTKPIRIIVGEAGGTTPDVVPRVLAPHMGKTLGQAIIIENRPGASSLIAYEHVATRADPDGYTVALASVVNLALLPLTVKDLKFDPPRDLPPVIGVADAELVIVTAAGKPWTTFADVLNYAKKNPGKLNFGSVAHSTRMNIELLIRSAGINVQVVPYSTGAQIYQAVLNGEADVIFTSILTAEGFGEKSRILAATGDVRRPPLQAVPTMTELGFPRVRGVSYSLNVRTGTPAAVIEKLNGAASDALRNPEVQAQFAKLRLGIVNSSPAAAAKAQADLAAGFAEIAREIGLKPQ